MGRYFLSFGGENRPAARALSSGLRSAGVDLFFDEEITYGEGWLARLEQELNKADGFLALVGKEPVSRWSQAELEIAINRQVNQPAFRIIPFVLPGARIEDLPAFLGRFQAFKVLIEPSDASPEYFATTSLLLGLRPLSEEASCPFPGLESFDESLAPYFFGRVNEIGELIARVRAGEKDNLRWLQLEGASGSGKSSLAKAGLVPAMRRATPAVGLSVRSVAVMRPGVYPLRNLAQAVYSAVKDGLTDRWNLDRVVVAFSESSSALVSLIREGTTPKAGFLLVVDQLEEVFTVGNADRVALTQFAAMLREALEDLDIGFYLVTTIRSDFLSHFPELPQLEELLASRAIRYYVSTLSPAGFRAAIEGPSNAAGLRWEEGLIERLLADTSTSEGSRLPLVAHVLYALWVTRQQNVMMHRSYDALGRVTGALTLSADAVVARLPLEAQVLTRKALLSLVREAPEATSSRRQPQDPVYTRRNTSRAEILASMGGGASAESVLTYLSGGRTAQLSGSSPAFMRLVTVTQEETEDRVDLVHEALIREWPRFKTWIKEHRDELRRRDALEAATSAWVAAGRPHNDLPTGEQLKYLRDAFTCSATARDFLNAAIARGQRLQRAKLYVGVAVATLLAVCYLMGCDFGFKIPGGRPVRAVLDEHRLSLFRPMPSIEAIRTKAHEIRSDLLLELRRRWMPGGSIHIDYQLLAGTDAWATSQTIAAMFACRECASDKEASTWAETALSSNFEPGKMRFGHDGHNYGWVRTKELQVTMAEPAVWTQVAIAKGYAHQSSLTNLSGGSLIHWLTSTEGIIDQYRAVDGIALNSFPRQLDKRDAGMYPTIMEIFALLERRASSIPGDRLANEDRIRQLATWLSAHFDSHQLGWPASGRPKSGIVDAIRFQAFSALLWAEHDVGFSIPREILRAIPAALEDVSEREYGYPSDQVQYLTPFLDDNGAQGSTNEYIVFIWHPWAVQVASRWLERAQQPRHADSRSAAIAHRALGHLVVDMGPDVIKRSKQTYTYEISETLYAISIL